MDATVGLLDIKDSSIVTFPQDCPRNCQSSLSSLSRFLVKNNAHLKKQFTVDNTMETKGNSPGKHWALNLPPEIRNPSQTFKNCGL